MTSWLVLVGGPSCNLRSDGESFCSRHSGNELIFTLLAELSSSALTLVIDHRPAVVIPRRLTPATNPTLALLAPT